MFEEITFLDTCQERLGALASKTAVSPVEELVWWDMYVDKSLLQKAIRRGQQDYAVNAANRLFARNERALWQRLAIIALEDVGVANVKLVAQVLLASSDRKLRQRFGGSKHVALCLVAAMCQSMKDRSTDDLIDALGSPDRMTCAKARVAELDEAELFDLLAAEDTNLHTRSLAALYQAHGCFEMSVHSSRRKSWQRLLQDLPEEIVPADVRATALLGLQVTKSIMAPFMALLAPELPDQIETTCDEFCPWSEIDGLPSWALDGHTRIGLHAFRLYRTRSPHMQKFLEKWSTQEISPAKTIAGLVFRTESDQLATRLQWDVGHQLRREAQLNRPGLAHGVPDDGLQIAREEWDLITQCRADSVAHYLR